MPTTEAGKRLAEAYGWDTASKIITTIEAEAFAAGMRHEQALHQDAMLAHAEMADYFEAEAVAAERERIKPFMDTIREALRIGAICFEGDSWFVSRDALGDAGYDDLDDAEKVLADARAAVLAIDNPEDTDGTG